MDWITFGWENSGFNPFSVTDFDPSNRASMSDALGSFADPLFGLEHLGVVTDLTSSVSARDAGDPFSGLGGETPSSPRPTSNAPGDAVSGQANGQWLQRLVEINMQLFDHANKAKAKAGDSGSAPESTRDNEASSSTIGRPAGFNSFDETIVLSFYLVRAIHSLYSPESLKLDEQSSLPVGPPPKLDSGTVLIIFSCYVRVLDLFMDRLGALRSTLNTTATTPPTAASSLTTTTTTTSFFPSNLSTSNGSNPNGAALHLPTLVACGCPLEGYPVLRLRSKLPSDCVSILWIHTFHTRKLFHYSCQPRGTAFKTVSAKIGVLYPRPGEGNTSLVL